MAIGGQHTVLAYHKNILRHTEVNSVLCLVGLNGRFWLDNIVLTVDNNPFLLGTADDVPESGRKKAAIEPEQSDTCVSALANVSRIDNMSRQP